MQSSARSQASESDQRSFIATMKGDKPDVKSIIFHKTCLDGCHKKMAKADAKFKPLAKCDNCHKK